MTDPASGVETRKQKEKISMDKYLRKNKRSGFTLAELLIVVAIIAVLVAVSIPIFNASLERSRKTVCETNRKTLLRQMVYERLTNETLSQGDAQKILDDSDAYCPSGGTYSVTVKDLFIKIECTIAEHGSSSGGGEDTGNTVSSSQFYSDFVDFVNHYDDSKGKNNDRMRAAFLAENGGKWPTLTTSDGNTYSVQPFYKEVSTADATEDRVWLFAKVESSSNTWGANLIYVDNTWYGITSYNGTPNIAGGQIVSATKFTSVDDLRTHVTEDTKSGKPAWFKVTDCIVTDGK